MIIIEALGLHSGQVWVYSSLVWVVVPTKVGEYTYCAIKIWQDWTLCGYKYYTQQREGSFS